MIEYNDENLKIVIDAINENLTIDLIPNKWKRRNVQGGSNNKFGHCHTVSGVIYKIFGPKNVHMYRGFDGEIYHWWIVDKNGNIIDPTVEQYTLLGKEPPYDKGEKSSMLGFDYKKRVLELYDRVQKKIQKSG